MLFYPDAPKPPTVFVSPSHEIEEDSSVTLTCNTEANPAANYTWCKKNSQTPFGKERQLSYSSVQPSDSGEYFCIAENVLGRTTSKTVFIDVKCE